MVDLFKELYRLNDEYHNAKERAIWSAATIYLGFSLGTIGWLATQYSIWNPWRVYFIVFAILLCLFSLSFIFIQNWNKVRSVKITVQMNSLIHKLDNSESLYSELQSAIIYPKEDTAFRDKCDVYWKFGRLDIIVLFVVLLFGAAQVIFLIFYTN